MYLNVDLKAIPKLFSAIHVGVWEQIQFDKNTNEAG